jgi:predicted transcriptional regulator
MQPNEHREDGILAVLRSQGYTNVEIAEIVGVTRTTITNWEAQESWPAWALWKMGFNVSLVDPVEDARDTLTALRDQINRLLEEEEDA